MKFVLNTIQSTQITNSLFLTNIYDYNKIILISKSGPLKIFCKQIYLKIDL